jgi:hypothetical protein
MTHVAWDNGAVAEIFGFLVDAGMIPAQKTTKTACGRRVAMGHIDNKTPTCAACIARENERREFEAYARAELAKYEAVRA